MIVPTASREKSSPCVATGVFNLPARMKANRRLAGCQCAICHDRIELGQEIRNCEHCKLSYHLECWEENRGCAVYGCPGAFAHESPPAAPSVSASAAKSQSMLLAHYEPQMEYAGFWLRVSALLIDALVILAGIGAVGFVAGLGLVLAGIPPFNALIYGSLLGLFIPWIYCAGLESSYRQATWGKALVGIIVTDMEGDRISLTRATGRFLCKVFSFAPLGLGCLLAGVTSKKQALHDLLSASLVIRK